MAGGRVADVFAADDVRDSFGEVIDTDGELVGPETVAVANRKVAALELRIFGKVSETLVVPVDYFIWNYDAQAMWKLLSSFVCSERASVLSSKTFPLVNDFAGFTHGVFGEELFAAAGAGVHEAFFGEFVENFLEKVKMTALDAFAVVFETEPGQVFADAVDVFLAGSALVVVFDAQVYFKVPF